MTGRGVQAEIRKIKRSKFRMTNKDYFCKKIDK